MGETTEISWCDSTWNPFRGCEKVSPGCKNCYITTTMPFRMSGQKHGDPAVYASEHTWNEPFRWNKKPWVCDACGEAFATQAGTWCGKCLNGKHHRRRVFTPSLSDWLWDKIAVDRLARFLDTISQCQEIDFLLLTKRPELFSKRMDAVVNYLAGLWNKGDKRADLLSWINGWNTYDNPRDNIWIGASVEDQPNTKRIADLLKIPAKVRFLSVEPLLGPVDLKFNSPWTGAANLARPRSCLDWVIVGGESGPNARACNVEWVRSVKDQCQAAGVPVFVKQLGSRPVCDCSVAVGSYSANCCEHFPLPIHHSKGGDPSEWPEDLRVQQFPSI